MIPRPVSLSISRGASCSGAAYGLQARCSSRFPLRCRRIRRAHDVNVCASSQSSESSESAGGKQIRRVGFSSLTTWKDFCEKMGVSENFPAGEREMDSTISPRTSQELDVAVLTFLVEFLSKPIVMFDEVVLHPTGRERPLYLLIYSVLSQLALLNFGQRSLVISQGPDDPSVHMDQEAPEDEQQQESRNVEHGRSEFVVLRVPPPAKLRESYNLMETLQNGGKAVMVVEVKKTVTFNNDIWQPLATALELAIQNETDPVTLLLTDASSWYFATVQLVQKIDNKGPPMPKGNSQAHGFQFQACGHEFCLFDWMVFKCDLLLTRRISSVVPQIFVHMHNVLYPGEDITKVADRAKLGSAALQALAVKWAEPVITDVVTSKQINDLKQKLEESKQREEESKQMLEKVKQREEESKQKLEESKQREEESKQMLEAEKKKAAQEIEALKRQLQRQQQQGQ
ncbi:hypothetical protein VOLCADRAFT_105079 [Volvox carteri f. nagariensis]|uniref:Uncharacterized protein n=1 Tax=Volvox carteri f. nagariensis TaxID=3068 RepID=D8TYA2_VOLCA|nr:uncharacterized protein VOLCADRAFT_105079 [Volvox carteri f. nagariensis]EFJ47515.1 hypothetical protein VOLCADRAFT_105079 [Volvox carteri f. nagariensis]|eukprot:XP_002951339.1 hypothetical protein VOLCADRAFT_105079 [Volvox carteri f. nagariensis]